MDIKKLSESPLLDLRPEGSFGKGHVLNSTNIPFTNLTSRIHELPPNSQNLNLLGYRNDLSAAVNILTSKGYRVERVQTVNDAELTTKKNERYLVAGHISKRLWAPARVVADFIKHYANLCEEKTGLDIACGSGRDSVFMASNGWSMTSVDHSPSALKRLRLLAKTDQQLVDERRFDLEHDDQWLSLLQPSYSVVVVIRYLHRPLLEQLRALIAPNGFIVYQTFMRGAEKFGSPKNPRYLLEKGELAERFRGFKIHKDKTEYLADGRPTNYFIAQNTHSKSDGVEKKLKV